MLEDDLCYRCPNCQNTFYGSEWKQETWDVYCGACELDHTTYPCPGGCGYTYDPIFDDLDIVTP